MQSSRVLKLIDVLETNYAPRAEALRTTRHPPSAVLKPPVQHVAEVVRSATAPLPQALLPPLSIRGGTGMASKKPGSTRRLPSRCCQSLSLVHPKKCKSGLRGMNLLNILELIPDCVAVATKVYAPRHYAAVC